MPPYFLEKLVYQETSLKAQNCTETMRITRVNHVLLSRAIFEYRPHHLILLNIFASVLLHAINASRVSEPSLSTYELSCELLKHQLKSFSHL